MVRVLHIFHEMENGGVEAFVMNNYRRIDREKIQFDFLTSVDRPGYFDDEILKLGGRLYHAYPLLRDPIRNYNDIANIVRKNKYQIVHRHTGSAFGYYDLRAARKGGAKHLILHAHNPQARIPILHRIVKPFIGIDCIRVACSNAAGKFLFGNDDFTILTNAIDCNEYKFSPDDRYNVRKVWGVGDKLVIGHIGRMERQKNHIKLLEIFSKVVEIEDAVLVCIGDGSLRNEIEKYAQKIGVKGKVLFLGNRNDVSQLINGFDIFCFPSLYEGFSITQIEIQANGLSIIASKDVIPKESNITGNVLFVSLDSSSEKWAEIICKNKKMRDKLAMEKVKAAGYDLEESSQDLVKFYSQLVEQED